jgi:cysteine peptidase C11 family protein
MSPLDLIGFDACLLGAWEVAVALQSRASYLVASEELEPGHGWDHRAISVLKDGADVEELGAALLAGYAQQAEEESSATTITLALTRLDRDSVSAGRCARRASSRPRSPETRMVSTSGAKPSQNGCGLTISVNARRYRAAGSSRRARTDGSELPVRNFGRLPANLRWRRSGEK